MIKVNPLKNRTLTSPLRTKTADQSQDLIARKNGAKDGHLPKRFWRNFLSPTIKKFVRSVKSNRHWSPPTYWSCLNLWSWCQTGSTPMPWTGISVNGNRTSVIIRNNYLSFLGKQYQLFISVIKTFVFTIYKKFLITTTKIFIITSLVRVSVGPGS